MSNDLEQMGYVFLSTYDRAGRKNEEHSPEYKALLSAIYGGDVKGFQMGGSKRWLVHKASADEFLALQAMHKSATPLLRKAEPACGDSSKEAAVVALCEINNGITLMQATLERLATAVENIATQPKTAQREFFSVTDTNSFHN
jgi:hypothetical protein